VYARTVRGSSGNNSIWIVKNNEGCARSELNEGLGESFETSWSADSEPPPGPESITENMKHELPDRKSSSGRGNLNAFFCYSFYTSDLLLNVK
jgi:hypothetical protein